MYEEGEDELIAALKEDLGKPATEALIFEIDFNKNFVKLAIAEMDKYVDLSAITNDQLIEIILLF